MSEVMSRHGSGVRTVGLLLALAILPACASDPSPGDDAVGVADAAGDAVTDTQAGGNADAHPGSEDGAPATEDADVGAPAPDDAQTLADTAGFADAEGPGGADGADGAEGPDGGEGPDAADGGDAMSPADTAAPGDTSTQPPVAPAATDVPIWAWVAPDEPWTAMHEGEGFLGGILPARINATYTIDAGCGAETVLFLYGPSEGAVFPDPPIAWAAGPAGVQVTLTPPLDGQYLLALGCPDGLPHDTSVTVSCEGEACPVPTFWHVACPPDFVADVQGCMADLAADPDEPLTDPHESAWLCADAEPMADAYDALCVGEERPVSCGVEYAAFWSEITSTCGDAGFYATLGQGCLFGARFVDVLAPESRVVVTRDRTVGPASPLTAAEEARIVAAVTLHLASVSTIAGAFEAADDHQVRLLEIVDLERRVFDVVELGMGDTSVGAILAGAEVVATISDGDLVGCTVAPGAGGTPCATDSDCPAPLACAGAIDGFGRCADVAAVPGEGDSCGTDPGEECLPGLACAGLTGGPFGLCVAPWMVGTFAAQPLASIPDGATVARTMTVRGLATVAMDVRLRATIRHTSVGELRVTLANPSGTEALVYAGGGSGTVLTLDQPVPDFPGDESVNGPWVLSVEDTATGHVGILETWSLWLTSRLD